MSVLIDPLSICFMTSNSFPSYKICSIRNEFRVFPGLKIRLLRTHNGLQSLNSTISGGVTDHSDPVQEPDVIANFPPRCNPSLDLGLGSLGTLQLHNSCKTGHELRV